MFQGLKFFCCSLIQAQKTSLPFDPPSLGALRHPNLVNVLGTTFSPVGDIHYVVVEAMPVGNMHEFLQHDLANVMTGAASFSAALGIVTGLQYLHESRPAIVHGDLRAEHVLLDEKLSAKVTCRVLPIALSTVSYLLILINASGVDRLCMSVGPHRDTCHSAISNRHPYHVTEAH